MLPELPPKHAFSLVARTDPAFVQARMTALQLWLAYVSAHRLLRLLERLFISPVNLFACGWRCRGHLMIGLPDNPCILWLPNHCLPCQHHRVRILSNRRCHQTFQACKELFQSQNEKIF